MKLKEQLTEMGLTPELAQRVIDEIFDGAYIPKSRFNELNEENKTLRQSVADRDKQLEELKKSDGDNAELKKQIETLQQLNAEQQKTHEAELNRLKLDNAVDTALTAAGAKNNTAVKALLADFLKDAKPDDSGAVKGLAAEIETLAKADATSFLFNTADGNGQPQFKGMQPGTAGGKTPPPQDKEPKDMNYDELCAYLEANPGAKLE